MGKNENAYGIMLGKPEGRSYLEDLHVDGKIILKWILKMYDGRAWTGFNCVRIGRRYV
jgi:hypothetical protein